MLWSQAIPTASDQFKQLLLELAQERSLDELLPLVTRRLAEHEDVALARLWLLDRGDRCGSCRNASACGDRTACLHLVASAARDRRTHAVTPTRLDGDFQRIPVGAFKVGAVAASGAAVVVADAATDPKIRRPDWVRQEGIASFAGLPLSSRGELLGVMGVFVRAPLTPAALDVLRIVASHAAAAIATARAFAQVDAMRRQLLVENQRLRQGAEPDALDDLIGSSEQLRGIRRQIAAVATTSATVLVLGESGTGKELAARAIHQRSQVSGGPFVELNCAAIPRELAESELFGHVRGAFSGATRDRVGRFEAAEGGTLFLDEIGELPFELQGKLLRVLQEGTYERVGEVRTRHARRTGHRRDQPRPDGRGRSGAFPAGPLLPAGGLPDHAAAAAPSARGRRRAGARASLERICRRLGRAPVTLTPEQLAELAARAWRGNVRELLNVLERAVISAQPGQPVVLPPGDSPRDPPPPAPSSPAAADVARVPGLRRSAAWRAVRRRPACCRIWRCGDASARTSCARSNVAAGGSTARRAPPPCWA